MKFDEGERRDSEARVEREGEKEKGKYCKFRVH